MPQGIYVHTTLNLHDIQPRLPRLNSLWWTTSNGSVFLPSSTPASELPSPTSSPPLSAPPASSSDGSGSSPSSSSDPSSGAANGGGSLSRRTSTPTSASSPGQTLTPTTIITSSPVVITSASSAFTSFSQLTFTTNVPLGSAVPDMGGSLANNHQPVCIGDGVDVQAVGLISTAILPSAVGLALWLLFAIIRPRFRQIYASREWFAPQGLRPEPLSDSLWAFLFPHVPLVPSLPTDDDDTEKTQSDPRAIPSDAELGQRVLWICLLIAAVWAFVGLAGALPLYLVDTPCLANTLPGGSFSGIYSTLQDLSVLRLLRLLDDGDFSTQQAEVLLSRAVEGGDIPTNLRVRFIVLTVLVIVLAMLPALYKILKEFSKLIAYRNWWLSVYCDGLEMGWLNAQRAPGFVGWGEQKLKTFLLNNRLSSTLETTGGRIRSGNNAGIGAGYSSNRRAQAFGDDVRYPMNLEEKMSLEINIHSLFSICDTQHLSLLIDERDYILNKLEIAETRYISSFRISTPEPSLLSDPPVPRQAPPPEDSDDIKRQISRPQALAGYRHRHRSRRQQNHGQDPSSSVSGAPTSYVAPQQYYKLRGVRGISGGRVASDSEHEGSAFGDTIQSRLVGTRFQEVNRDSVAYGKLPVGSRMALDDSGELQPVMDSPEPLVDSDMPRHHILDPSSGNEADVETTPLTSSATRSSKGRSRLSGTDEPNYPNDMESNRANHASPVTFASDGISPEEDILGVVRRSTKDLPAERRDTFPMRNRTGGAVPNSQLPPHLRLQPQGPFVRPVSGLDHDDLGEVYSDIGQWRTKLKTINAEIADAQNAALNDIAEGVRLKGWLITGKGIRFLPGIEMIEGRSKEDIRWTELQQENGTWNKTMFWTVVVMISMFLGAALIAVSALAVADAPDVAFYLAFFRPIANAEIVSSGLAITIVPALAATLFIFVALAFVQYSAQLDGSVSITASRLTAFKATFFILAFISTIWLLAAGSLIFSLRAFDTSNERALTVANGSVYMSAFFLTLVINVAIIAPALLLLQPRRLLNVLHEERSAVTPRQRFRAVYPRSYDPSYALGCTTLAVIFAATFSLIFPLIGPAVVLLLALTMIAHRFLVGYVYGRTEAATGGLTQLWLLRRLATIVTFQSILLGLIYLTRRLFIEGGILVGVGVFAIFLVEIYTTYKMRLPSRKTLHEETHQALQIFEETAHAKRRIIDEEETSDQLNVTPRPVHHRGSFASVLEMMSITLAVTPSNSQSRAAIPLETEFLDDLVATERAARTHPDAAPHLPPLSFADHAEEMVSVLYANEVLAPPPMIWLPNDSAGIARSEAYDLEHYHDLRTTLDVKTSDDVIPRRRSSSSRRP